MGLSRRTASGLRLRGERPGIGRLRPWIEVRFARSSGPGGQNVNKVNTRVTLLFDFEGCCELNDSQRARLRRRPATRLSRDGRLCIVSQESRSQAANRAAAEQRLLEVLRDTLRRRKPRRPTQPTVASRERRLRAKRRRGELKQLRQKRSQADE